jgi:hypothetical protein
MNSTTNPRELLDKIKNKVIEENYKRIEHNKSSTIKSTLLHFEFPKFETCDERVNFFNELEILFGKDDFYIDTYFLDLISINGVSDYFKNGEQYHECSVDMKNSTVKKWINEIENKIN